MTRRELLVFAASAAVLRAKEAPASPVAIARCTSYDADLPTVIAKMFDDLGGARRLVGNKR